MLSASSIVVLWCRGLLVQPVLTLPCSAEHLVTPLHIASDLFEAEAKLLTMAQRLKGSLCASTQFRIENSILNVLSCTHL
jgi:hypothetical protein